MDWEWLPKHLLDMIVHKLVSLSDYCRFGAVCKEWHSVSMANKDQFVDNKILRQVPFLMVPTKDNSDERRGLYHIIDNKLVHDLELRVSCKKRMAGSSHCWLFTVEETYAITMINPFSGATIQLPPIMDRSRFDPHPEWEGDLEYPEPDFEIKKAILSVDPAKSPNDYVVVAIYSGYCNLAFIRAGDEAWTYMDEDKFVAFEDLMYYKGELFAVDCFCGVIKINTNRTETPKVEVIAPKDNASFERETYMVESSKGEILIVERSFKIDADSSQHATKTFKVFELRLQETGEYSTKRVQVKNLGGDALFLGDNHSICVSASEWPGCKPDSIYYTDDYTDIRNHPRFGRPDIGVFW